MTAQASRFTRLVLTIALLALPTQVHGARSRMKPTPSFESMGANRPAMVQSSAAGDRLKPLPAPRLQRGRVPDGVTVRVDVGAPRQTIEGIGGALTEASASVLARMPLHRRQQVLDGLFGPTGADLTMARTHIGSCDFTVKGRYSYAEVPGDTALLHFSIAPDEAGFEGALDPTYSTLSLIRDARSRQPGLKIVASPWTAPDWMKDNGKYYDKGVAGGRLKPDHHGVFARYIGRYIKEYAAAGVPIWAVTPLNEPGGVGGQWESMEMSPAELRDYIRDALGPELAGTGVRILQYDHNRDERSLDYCRAVLQDSASARFVWGTAVHWYSTTNSANGHILDAIQAMAPGKPIVHTEGCIDGIGTRTNSPAGRFLGWRNDAWWWQPGATDWGWDWAAPEEKPMHPKYVPMHRYARDLIDGLNHGFVGWIDWNLVLDERGGPNHVDNRCGAPFMVDVATDDIHATPILYAIAHVSRYVRPGDRVVASTLSAPDLGPDDFHATAVLSADGHTLTVVALNTSSAAIPYHVVLGDRHASTSIAANAMQTVRLDLRDTNR